MSKEKEYGLIIPGKQKKIPLANVVRSFFGEETSSNSSDDDVPKVRGKLQAIIGPGAMERRQARSIQQKALAEDPTIFQYDELYDDIETKRNEEKKLKSSEERKPKYIGKLLQQAERRKLENERRVERQVQKEREAEGEQFKGKESFVTSAYKKKLEELKKAEEEEKREEYLERIGDVKKQGNLDGFYRHLYEQKLGPKETDHIIDNTKTENNDNPSKEEALKSKQNIKSRTYRKRLSSEDETENEDLVAKKAHIQSNLDADSDFSIDDSSSEEENENHNSTTNDDIAVSHTIISAIKIETEVKENITGEDKGENIAIENIKVEKIHTHEIEQKDLKPEKKIDIWKKRTIGDVFDAALQKFYERKNARKR